MTWEEIDKDWGGLQKRHRMEIAQAVARYCVGHSIGDVAERLDHHIKWVQNHLDLAGIAAATGGGDKLTPPLAGQTNNVQRNEVPRVLKEFAPAVSVKLNDDGRGNQSVVTVTGDDAEDFQPYLDHYTQQGHTPAAATRLAKAEWAAESAVEAGVIKEAVNKRNQKVNQILFPNDEQDTFELKLRHHVAAVRAAARFLDEAKINHLRRPSTCERVAQADEAWREQMERILNFHPTLTGE
tara:strand:- start:10638 stop:11354 length:717 start_codon:yes stop_codon:yes gene_type:complete